MSTEANSPSDERRAAPKPADIPSGDRQMYSSGEGLHDLPIFQLVEQVQ